MPNSSPHPAPSAAGWRFDTSYATLPATLFARQNPMPVRAPRMVLFNSALAESLGLNAAELSGTAGTAIFAGNALPEGATPLAQAYAGHQFGGFNMLGDGRALLLGEHRTPAGARVDIQLKGSGKTPFSRRGDGRAALGPMLREYIISEAMHALGIPTTRSLAVVSTGEVVLRETPLQGAILTRVAASHIRVGTFEYLAAKGDVATLKTLADYTMARHYPELVLSDTPYADFLAAMLNRQAARIAQWQCVGFIHGVMNTDNMAISSETMDYGPCAFMDRYDPRTVFSAIDQQGRYAYGNQPAMGQWNGARFAEALLPLLHENQDTAITIAETLIEGFAPQCKQHWLSAMRAKLGLMNQETDDEALIQSLLQWMHSSNADYTTTWRSLGDTHHPMPNDAAWSAWHARWQARLGRQPISAEEARTRMNAHNPAIIARNHRVEEALTAAEETGDIGPTQRLLAALQAPYARTTQHDDYRSPPAFHAYHYTTHCGT